MNDTLKEVTDWLNHNEGSLALIYFIFSIGIGSGIWKSLTQKPKLRIKFIEKLTFFSAWQENKIDKVAFSVYMSIANVGNVPTSISKIYLGYEIPSKGFYIRRKMRWIPQLHSLEMFTIKLQNGSEMGIPSLRVRDFPFDKNNKDYLGIGNSVTGIAYFDKELEEIDDTPFLDDELKFKVTIRIEDIFGIFFDQQIILPNIEIEQARKFNSSFGKELVVKI